MKEGRREEGRKKGKWRKMYSAIKKEKKKNPSQHSAKLGLKNINFISIYIQFLLQDPKHSNLKIRTL